MLFFYDRISDLNKTYPVLFNKKSEQDGEEQSGITKEDGGNSFADKWGWIDSIRVISDLVHSPWDIVFKMNIIEFLNLVCFSKDLAAERERIMKENLKKK